MNKYDKMIEDGKLEEFEKLVRKGDATLEDLSEEMFQKFKDWIESPTKSQKTSVPHKKS